MNRLQILVALIAACGAGAAQTGESGRPEDAVREFYTWVLANPAVGLSTENDRRALEPLVAPAIARLLERAAEVEVRCAAAAAPDEKPHMIEGDLYAGTPEGASEVAYGAVRAVGERRVADVDLVYIDERFPRGDRRRAIVLRNQVELARASGRWVVHDIRFPRGRSLAAELGGFIAQGRRCRAR